jgi:inosine-uridine nucleoside N-ribohydrolase
VPLVIFDTDMGPDIDDALGLAMLHAYQKAGKIELAAVTISRNSEAAAKYTDALNHFYGRPNIPIGIYRSSSAPYFNDRGNYIRLADNMSYDISSNQIQDGYKLQRQVMADGLASGREVLLIQTGFSGNVSQLLNSGGDSISSKSGVELAREAVKELSIMAGAFDMNVIEFNIEHDISPARNVFAKWPGPMAVSPFELGYHIHYPYSAIKSNLAWDHPVRKSYELYDLSWHQDASPYYNMRSWDLTSIMHAIEPQSGYFLTSGTGKVSVAGDGRTSFSAGSGQHYLLDRGRQYSYDQRKRVVDRMVELVSTKP